LPARSHGTTIVAKPAALDQEAVEYVPGRHVRMDNETHGSLWIGMVDVETKDAQSVLTLTMAYCER
jgi:hypothetical protein